MKQQEIKTHLINGTLEQAIKSNNRQWFLIVCIVLTIFIGNSIINRSQVDSIMHEKRLLKMENDFLSIANQKLIEENKKAVYFSDIKK